MRFQLLLPSPRTLSHVANPGSQGSASTETDAHPSIHTDANIDVLVEPVVETRDDDSELFVVACSLDAKVNAVGFDILPLSPVTRIFVALRLVVMRAGFNGLGAQVETRLNHDTWSGHPFVFIERVTFCPYALFS